MEKIDPAERFAALGHPARLAVLRLLVQAGPQGLPAGDIAARLDARNNTLSAYLAALSRVGLIGSERQGRSIRYFADMAGLRGLVAYLLEDCCGGDVAACAPVLDRILHPNPVSDTMTDTMTDKRWNVLFLCTGNSARSLIAEAILTQLGADRFRAYSAGSQPTGAPHPMTLDLLARHGHDLSAVRSKSWDEFATEDAPQMDFVFTVCDSAAAEPCPIWPGQPMTAHWGLPDPAAAAGSEAERALAFAQTYGALASRLGAFVNLPIASLDRLALKRQLDAIGTADASSPAVTA